MRRLVRGIIHQDVQAAELAHGPVDQAPAILFVGKIAGQRKYAASGFLHQADCLLRILFFFGQVADREVRAFARVSDRHRFADAAVGAGDQCDLVA